MPAPVAGIHVFGARKQDVDGRDKPGHDDDSAQDGLAEGVTRYLNTLELADYASQIGSIGT
jgi:hypothetical protein